MLWLVRDSGGGLIMQLCHIILNTRQLVFKEKQQILTTIGNISHFNLKNDWNESIIRIVIWHCLIDPSFLALSVTWRERPSSCLNKVALALSSSCPPYLNLPSGSREEAGPPLRVRHSKWEGIWGHWSPNLSDWSGTCRGSTGAEGEKSRSVAALCWPDTSPSVSGGVGCYSTTTRQFTRTVWMMDFNKTLCRSIYIESYSVIFNLLFENIKIWVLTRCSLSF